MGPAVWEAEAGVSSGRGAEWSLAKWKPMGQGELGVCAVDVLRPSLGSWGARLPGSSPAASCSVLMLLDGGVLDGGSRCGLPVGQVGVGDSA